MEKSSTLVNGRVPPPLANGTKAVGTFFFFLATGTKAVDTLFFFVSGVVISPSVDNSQRCENSAGRDLNRCGFGVPNSSRTFDLVFLILREHSICILNLTWR